uniref:Uncharacterized protein n=1 Tax=Physcomitrium patens TaxID=3218 RepID=A0A2K1J0P3_PHYPA|nr:hypothetical protein PHYPA_022995 [Physcomitrium patens]
MKRLQLATSASYNRTARITVSGIAFHRGFTAVVIGPVVKRVYIDGSQLDPTHRRCQESKVLRKHGCVFQFGRGSGTRDGEPSTRSWGPRSEANHGRQGRAGWGVNMRRHLFTVSRG